jgi:uncharacterized protein
MTTMTKERLAPGSACARHIEAPPRMDRVATGVVLACIASLSLSIYPDVPPAACAALAAVAGIVAYARKAWPAVHVALLASVLPLTMATRLLWPVPGILALAVYGALVLLVPSLRRTAGWLRRGSLDRTTRLLLPVTILLPAIALPLWFLLFRPDLSAYGGIAAGTPLWVIALGVLAYAMSIAAAEEAIWRGVVMQGTDAAFGAGYGSVAAQALGFGVWHFYGFPGGVVGVGLTAFFAAMMGLLRRRTRGMLVPWLAHVCADTVIITIVLAHVREG